MTVRLRLPPGITGFGAEHAPYTPAASFTVFQTLCHALARQLHGRVGTFTSCAGQVTPNFHTAELKLRSSPCILLGNAYYLWLAAVFAVPDGGLDPSALLWSSELDRAITQFSWLSGSSVMQYLVNQGGREEESIRTEAAWSTRSAQC